MADFHQAGIITTLHKLGIPNLAKIEAELRIYARRRPVVLVLPALISDVKSEAMAGIIEELKKVTFLNEIVLALGNATDEEFIWVKEFMSVLPQEVKIININGQNIQNIFKLLGDHGIGAGKDGKGRSVWMAYGYILATEKSSVIALHDCDIINYSKELLARLCYPVVNSTLDYSFCKAYYARICDKLYGRVTRLFITPLLNSLLKLVEKQDLLLFLNSFRYPLAGEFCMQVDLARINRIPWDWGLEIGVLAEIYRNESARSVCQVDVSDNYEHKHQILSTNDAKTGLKKMSIDIAKSLFRTLCSEGIVFSDAFFRSLVSTYLKQAEDTISRYEADAAINCLTFDRHEEAVAVETFTDAILIASNVITHDPLSSPLIPNWNRVISAVPEILDTVKKAVEDDNCEG